MQWFGLNVLCILMAAGHAQQTDVVNLKQGAVKGRVIYSRSRYRPVFAFLGIPYARSPIEDLRFRPPQRPQPWNATFNAQEFGDSCPQLNRGLIRTSEDCLNLNVWTTKYPGSVSGQAPVIVFLEGEDFATGSTSEYPAEDLVSDATNEMVVVSVNYRLNVFGFLSTEDELAPGNLGLRDQKMALDWVRENIDRFGGDPQKITLMGHGSGAASALLHMIYENTRPGIITRVIAMSGNPLSLRSLSENPRRMAEDLGRRLSCQRDVLVNCLQSKNYQVIMRAYQSQLQDNESRRNRREPLNVLYAPVVDRFLRNPRMRMVPVTPIEALTEGRFNKIPVLTGITADDGLYKLHELPDVEKWTYNQMITNFAEDIIPMVLRDYRLPDLAALTRTIQFYYTDWVPFGDKITLVEQIAQFYTDAYYTSPNERLVNLLARADVPTYMYVFDYIGPYPQNNKLNYTGAGHGSDLWYLFGPLLYRNQIDNRELGFGEMKLIDDMQEWWGNFAATGNPMRGRVQFGNNNAAGISWRMYTRDSPQYFALEQSASRGQRTGYRQQEVSLWMKFLPALSEMMRVTTTRETSGTSWLPTRTTYSPTTGASPQKQALEAKYETVVWVLGILIAILGVAVFIMIFYVCFQKRRSKSQSQFSER